LGAAEQKAEDAANSAVVKEQAASEEKAQEDSGAAEEKAVDAANSAAAKEQTASEEKAQEGSGAAEEKAEDAANSAAKPVKAVKKKQNNRKARKIAMAKLQGWWKAQGVKAKKMLKEAYRRHIEAVSQLQVSSSVKESEDAEGQESIESDLVWDQEAPEEVQRHGGRDKEWEQHLLRNMLRQAAEEAARKKDSRHKEPSDQEVEPQDQQEADLYFASEMEAAPPNVSRTSNASGPEVLKPLESLTGYEQQAMNRTRQLAALDCVLSEWSDWSDCRKVERDGMRVRFSTRYREVLQPRRPGGQPCEEDYIARRACLTRGTLRKIRGVANLMYWPVDYVERLLGKELDGN